MKSATKSEEPPRLQPAPDADAPSNGKTPSIKGCSMGLCAAQSGTDGTGNATKQLYRSVLDYFRHNVPVAESELNFDSPYQLIVAVILSAQCTDKRVNITTPALFDRYPDFASLASAELSGLLPFISSISYPRSKAQHLIGMARRVCDEFGGNLPRSRSDLMSLPGVGQKTANVVSSILWGEAVVAVDTHVFRVARRVGLSEGRNVLEVERDLEANIPNELRPIAHHWLILHGRYICTARKPKCGTCPLSEFCLKRL